MYCPARLGAACWWGKKGLPGAGEAVESSLIVLQEGDAPETARCTLSGSSHDEDVKCRAIAARAVCLGGVGSPVPGTAASAHPGKS